MRTLQSEKIYIYDKPDATELTRVRLLENARIVAQEYALEFKIDHEAQLRVIVAEVEKCLEQDDPRSAYEYLLQMAESVMHKRGVGQTEYNPHAKFQFD